MLFANLTKKIHINFDSFTPQGYWRGTLVESHCIRPYALPDTLKAQTHTILVEIGIQMYIKFLFHSTVHYKHLLTLICNGGIALTYPTTNGIQDTSLP